MVSFLVTWPVRQFALYVGFVDRPSARKVHLRPMPLLGGVAIYVGFVLAVAMTIETGMRMEVLGIVSGATLLAVTGILDDSGILHHQIKLFVSMPLAACMLVAAGIRPAIFSQIIGGKTGTLIDVLLTILWVVGITAAFSILDHMDGLCAGVAAIAAAFFTLSAVLNGQRMVCTLAAAALGASLGFLRWNFAPAKIFMGDGGAMFLGFLMATLGLKLRPAVAHPAVDWLAPVLILAVPIFDTTLISISRSRRGLLPFASPGKDHTAHRLSNLGLGHTRAVLTVYLVGCVFGILGVAISYLRYFEKGALCVFLLATAVLAVVALERSPYEDQRQLVNPAAPAPQRLTGSD
ncbi:MAG TPA: MraY family glycosyltransferase [Candidatus Acidoferrales bacterium]|nr:MraY family glycosyltransferase [Candidatus Acidoferrales bacterium]